MKTLNNMPGFTAEAALDNVSTRYQTTAALTVHGGGIVEPAGTVFLPNKPIPCLRWRCIPRPNQNPKCFRTLGFWNSATSRCE